MYLVTRRIVNSPAGRLRSLQIKQGWRRLIKMLTGQGGEATG